MGDVNPPTRYSSPRRDQAAAATRRAVLEAAHRLFVEDGYAATTIDRIAAAAQVSRPTVFSVGTKAQILELVRDVVIAGDDEPVAVADRAAHAEIRAAPDAPTTLRLHARNVAAINRRYAEVDEVVRQAADSEPALRALWETSEHQRLHGAALVVDDLMHKGTLAVDRATAIDLLWLYMAPDLPLRLRQRGWSDDDYGRWLADTLVAQLLPAPQPEQARAHDAG